jgi:hypothetical protein
LAGNVNSDNNESYNKFSSDDGNVSSGDNFSLDKNVSSDDNVNSDTKRKLPTGTMTSAVSRSIVASEGTALAEIKQFELKGQINWKINDFLAWTAFKKTGFKEISPEFKFNFPEVNKCFTFQLELLPKGQPFNENTKGLVVGIFFTNLNSEELNIKVLFSFLNSVGAKVERFSSFVSFEAQRSWGTPNIFSVNDLTSHPQTLLPGGHLQIQCNFTIYHPEPTPTALNPIQPARETLQTAMLRLWSDSDSHDFQIVCDGKTFRCHENILANKSDVLKQMMAQAGTWKENEERAFEIEDFAPAEVEMMLYFIYTNELPPNAECTANTLLIGDKYNVKGLVNLCEVELSNKLELNNAINILEASDQVVDAKQLKGNAIRFVADNIKSFFDTSDFKRVVGPNPELLHEILKLTLG